MKMNYYALFAGGWYYPEGGFNDLKMVCHSVDELKAYYERDWVKLTEASNHSPWAHIVDLNEMKIIWFCSHPKDGWSEKED